MQLNGLNITFCDDKKSYTQRSKSGGGVRNRDLVCDVECCGRTLVVPTYAGFSLSRETAFPLFFSSVEKPPTSLACTGCFLSSVSCSQNLRVIAGQTGKECNNKFGKAKEVNNEIL